MIVIGIDPGVAVGKPRALVKIDPEAATIVYVDDHLVVDDYLLNRLLDWECHLSRELLEDVQPSALVCIEDARPRGTGGAALRVLVTILRECAEANDIPVVLVNPSKVKSTWGKTKAQIAANLALVYDLSGLPEGDDWTDAVAIADVGYHMWRREQAGEGA